MYWWRYRFYNNINNFLDIDEYINTEEYKDEQIFSFQYPSGENLQYSNGKILKKKDKYFLYSLDTKKGSSGSPLILINNLKLIGLHKGIYKDEKIVVKNEEIEIDIGIQINLVINKINFIKGAFDVTQEYVGKEIQIY